MSLSTDRISSEMLQEVLLAVEQITTGITALSLSAVAQPDQSPRIRTLLSDLLELVQQCEADLWGGCGP